jgi:hypothetical protein
MGASKCTGVGFRVEKKENCAENAESAELAEEVLEKEKRFGGLGSACGAPSSSFVRGNW